MNCIQKCNAHNTNGQDKTSSTTLGYVVPQVVGAGGGERRRRRGGYSVIESEAIEEVFFIVVKISVYNDYMF